MILVIGNNELLGAALEKHLQDKGFSVSGWNMSDIHQWTEVDSKSKGLLDIELILEKLIDVNIVINCSSFVSYLKSDYQKLLKINVEGTANLVNCCLSAGIGHFIQMSHVESFGFRQQDLMLTEDDIKLDNLKRSVYGLSRFLGDLEVQRGLAEGLRTTILNCGYLINDVNECFDDFNRMLDAGFRQNLSGRNGYLILKDAVKVVEKILNQESLPQEQYILVSKVLDHNDVLLECAKRKGIHLGVGKMNFLKRWKLSKKLNNGIGYSKDYLDQMNRNYDYKIPRILEALSIEFKS